MIDIANPICIIAKNGNMTFVWDDLRYVLAISRSTNLAAAAASLSVNHSTMFRRLNALESAPSCSSDTLAIISRRRRVSA